MKYDVKRLKLFEPLVFTKTEQTEQSEQLSAERLIRYQTAVTARDMNPDRSQYLINPTDCGIAVSRSANTASHQTQTSIEPGLYLFVQGIYTDEEAIITAAEALHLEALWQEVEPADMNIYLRFIQEGDTTIFQLFRRLTNV